jgi:hypothetical protein
MSGSQKTARMTIFGSKCIKDEKRKSWRREVSAMQNPKMRYDKA